MNSLSEQIAELIGNVSLTAPQMTHALKMMGNGNMQNGIRKMVDFLTKSARNAEKIGKIKGIFWGASGTIVIKFLIDYIKETTDENKKLKREGQEIVNCLEHELTEEGYRFDDIHDQ